MRDDVSSGRSMACVLGDRDLMRPLGLAGIPCAVVSKPGGRELHSRHVRAAIPWKNAWGGAEQLVEALERFGSSQSRTPVLFYEHDQDLLLVSRFRERLARTFRFVIAAPALVEELVDKGRFQALAERHGLPVPATRRLCAAAEPMPAALGLAFPVIIKPLTHRDRPEWGRLTDGAKVMKADTPQALRELWPQLAALGMEFLVQTMIPGPETRIESYHVYVDPRGEVVADFTGRKIRTYPTSCGYSTALTITNAPDVAALGRDVIRTIGLQGVAKLDFKRGPDGALHLLEINPRFTLWAHLGAVAGVNLPALVYADVLGLPRPAVRPARVGMRWCKLSRDWRAARESGLTLARWAAWALRCEAKSEVAPDDPMPLLRGAFAHVLRRHGQRRNPPAAERGTPDTWANWAGL